MKSQFLNLLKNSCVKNMAKRNISVVVEFILLGFADLPNYQGFLFSIFLFIYMGILVGNGLIIIITKIDPTLQIPMYFFLSHFSFLEICYTSVTLPRMLRNLLTQKRNISFLACSVQLCFFLILGGTECFLLAVMAYDRYMAICNPLNYPLIMNPKACIMLVVGSWISAIPVQIAETYQIFSLSFCDSNKLNHVFCDVPPLLKLACGDISVNEFYSYAGAILFAMIPFLLILLSYIKIITTIQKLPSAMGRQKAFSTCSSHLMVVVLFFGSGIISYLLPNSKKSPSIDKILSLIYSTVTPIFNPLIYCLRNKDILMALKKFLLK
ncbi:olfactory receptor 10AG1-like isoform X2 [Dromiciops gliroides]|uniref:olfactory receptor 10AG1-like isoform X2 n=1 Tax=Dromiciops gliroides TaxID=33562 RepID=UPI001CC7CC4E|nr:olfactory receptor 10AG1-like isoform X2 [Dromiciops gliroides]